MFPEVFLNGCADISRYGPGWFPLFDDLPVKPQKAVNVIVMEQFQAHCRFIEYMPLGSTCSSEVAHWDESEVIPLPELIETLTASCVEAGLGEMCIRDRCPACQGCL